MRQHKRRPLLLLFIGIISCIGLCALIYFSTPTAIFTFTRLSAQLPISVNKFMIIPSMPLFFVLLWLFLFGTGAFIFKSKIHGILIATFVIIYLIFRLNRLTNLFFLLLLLALFVTLELFISNKNK